MPQYWIKVSTRHLFGRKLLGFWLSIWSTIDFVPTEDEKISDTMYMRGKPRARKICLFFERNKCHSFFFHKYIVKHTILFIFSEKKAQDNIAFTVIPRLHVPSISEIKSSQDKSSKVKSSQAKTSQVKSGQVVSSQVSKVKSSQTKSSQVKPSQAKTSQVKSSWIESSWVESRQVKSCHVKSSEIKTSQDTSSPTDERRPDERTDGRRQTEKRERERQERERERENTSARTYMHTDVHIKTHIDMPACLHVHM